MSDRLLDVSAVAKALGRSAETIRAWIRQGKVAVVCSPTKRYKVPASELERLRKTQNSQTAPS